MEDVVGTVTGSTGTELVHTAVVEVSQGVDSQESWPQSPEGGPWGTSPGGPCGGPHC